MLTAEIVKAVTEICLSAEIAKAVTESFMTEEEIKLLCLLYDHHKILGLPSGEKITDKQISDAFEAKFWPFFFKSHGIDVPSTITAEEVREKFKDVNWESIVPQRCMEENQKEGEFGSLEKLIVCSYYILTDPERREFYQSWRTFVKILETMKIINREKEKLQEYELLSSDDLRRVIVLRPWIRGVWAITLPVTLPARICWLIGSLGYKAIQSAVSSTGECSSSGGGEDIQDWELVDEDDCVADNNPQEKQKEKQS